MTFPAVLAWFAITLIPLDFTVSPHKSWKTLAVVTPLALLACCSIQALTMAAVDVYLAGLSLPLGRAHTLEAILQVDTGSTLSTWTGGTLIQIVSTGRTLPAWGTLALKSCGNLMACTTAGTRIGNTGVLSYLAGLAGVSLWTGAVVLVWFCVHAGSSIDTRLVATTVIQIFITQQATPVPLAVALPGVVAGPMDASGIKHTFITELALPPIATRASSRDRAAAMQQVAALLADRCPAVWAHPAIQAHLGS